MIKPRILHSYNFLHCCGSVNGKHKHVRMRCLGRSGSNYYNYKGYFSMALIAIADADYKFVAVDIGRELVPSLGKKNLFQEDPHKL